ncbi:MAG: cytochrome c-type biogenesis CcmF C-terminal domain-containing protein [Bacteroidota bacterium]|nr:cytochrome c-type biogenesis CcmF C-terminal domain-containing protein [Bacteroidota bacterium]
MIGALIIKIAFAAAFAASVLYFYQHKKPSKEILRLARIFYSIAVAGIISASGMLLYLIVTHQFQYYYVWNYSSTDLPGPLLVSTFYAGQEGSFMLWAFFTSITGILLMRYSSTKQYEPELMTIYSAILMTLILMVVVKNPFKFIWEQFPSELLHVGNPPTDATNFIWVDKVRGLWSQVPAEGKGLNPLLQNYWMVIHPQILFIGFTSMSIPFAYAVAGMLKRDYVSWIRVAAPWTVFGSLVLGTGIILGGFWAYETLGWGGYWGWDPVENSSLVPWLVCVASIHTMLAQRKNGSYIKTNFVLSMFCFILVLYSTFLTRSGVLGETSVHSFVDPGMWVYWLLISVIVLFGAIGFGLFFSRWKEMPVVPVQHTLLSREFALFLGASALVCSSIFIVIGTSSPIITNILKGKTSAVDTSYYVTTVLPLGVAIALLAGIGQLLWWKNSKPMTLLEQLRIPAGLAVVFTTVTFYMGATHPAMVIFIFASSFALFTNLMVGYRIMKGNVKMAGGAIAHIGIAMMFLGFVASAKYDTKQTVNLEQGRQMDVLGYKMKYIGYEPRPRGRFAFNVEVEKEGQKFIVAPVMFQGSEEGSLIRNPDIVNLLTKDFYVSPLSLEVDDGSASGNEVTIFQTQSVEVEGMQVKYLGYDFSQQQGKGNYIVVNLEVSKDGKKEVVKPTMTNMRGNVNFETVKNSAGFSFTIKAMKPNKEDPKQSSVTLTIGGLKNPNQPAAPKPETLVVEASVKPFINMVWLGTGMLIFGFIITIFRRGQESFHTETWK